MIKHISKRYLHALTLVLRSIFLNRKRCLFAVLGIFVGIAAVTTLASLGYSSQQALENELKKLGTNMLIIEAARPSQNRAKQEALLKTLTELDITILQNEVNGIGAVAPVLLQTGEVKYNDDVLMNISTFATRSPFMQICDLNISQGRVFTNEDDTEAKKVILLGHTVFKLLFDEVDPIGEMVKLNNSDYEVIGILTEKGLNAIGEDQDDIVIIPISTARQLPGVQGHLTHIYVEVKHAEMIPEAKESIVHALRAAHQLQADQTDYFNVLDQAQLLTARNDILGSMEELSNILAIIILLAGGLGITAVQLISIHERIWEIGLHRAIGARKNDIIRQFLLESAILGGIGGLAGIVLGVIIPLTMASAYSLTPVIAWPVLIISFLFSVFIGITAGIYPAIYASRLDPVTALRS